MAINSFYNYQPIHPSSSLLSIILITLPLHYKHQLKQQQCLLEHTTHRKSLLPIDCLAADYQW